jgi:hypothetical protein
MRRTFTMIIKCLEDSIIRSGYHVRLDSLWVPEFGWNIDEDKAKADPFELQYLAALHIFRFFFNFDINKSWVHLAAEMQAGKTGVVSALLRMIMIRENMNKISIRPSDVFVITGMSDKAWKKQTRERLPRAFRENVHHNGGLNQIAQELVRKYERNGNKLSDIMVILDESHFASAGKNRPARIIFDTMARLCPPAEWAANNIRLLTISATDPAAVVSIADHTDKAAVVKLHTTAEYQSVGSLNQQGRIHEPFDVGTEEGVKSLLDFVTATYGDNAPLYHIIRPKQGRGFKTREHLEKLYPGCVIIEWDSERKKPARASDGSSTTSSELEDINQLLSVEPSAPTFIIIKNMFYASKTLDDKYAGVFHDRIGHMDGTNLQSLLGRACGYNKNGRTHIFTSLTTVKTYLDVWLAIEPTETAFAADPELLDRKMPGILAYRPEEEGALTQLSLAPTRRVPAGAAGSAGADPATLPVGRHINRQNEDDFDSEWSQWCSTVEEARAWWEARKTSRSREILDFGSEGEFLVCSTRGGGPHIVKVDEVNGIAAGKKTACISVAGLKAGAIRFRPYVAYSDISDPTTVQFRIHAIKRR